MSRPPRFLPRDRRARWPVLAAALLAAGTAHAAPRAEIQVGLCGEPAAIERALDLVSRGPAYQTWLFDDPSLSLFARGVRLRLRMHATRPELTLKVAGQDCRALPPGLLPAREGKCEYDVHGDRTEGAVSLTRRLDAATAAALVEGTRAPGAALSEAQARYLRDMLHQDGLPAGVRALGPIANRVLATRDGAYDVDVSALPGGQQYVEISTRVPPARVAAAQSALSARLAQAGVTACGDQSAQAVNKLRALTAR